MVAPLDVAVGDFGRTRPRLRRDLIVCPRTAGSETFYLLEDRAKARFFRVGLAEYRFISLLDGRTPVGEALSLAARTDPEHAISEEESIRICQWLLDAELLEPSTAAVSPAVAGNTSTKPKKSAATWNPLFARIPLGVPDPFFVRITPWFGWLFSPAAYIAWLVLLAVAALAMVQHWPRAVAESSVLLAPENWVWLAGCWLVLKIVHEAAHGTACKLRGGYVRETGLLFILLLPATYVDVTSAWSFPSKWRRIETAAAGIYVETWLAACAALAWCFTGPGVVSHTLLNIVALASIGTVVINANPLMRFDGYYVLSDLLEIPNLYQRAQQCTLQFLRHLVFGEQGPAAESVTARRWFIGLYGAAALVWRLLFCVGLLLAAALLFQGAGIVLAVVALVSWTARPVFRFLKLLLFAQPGQRRSRLRFFLVAGMPCSLLMIAAAWCPWPGACTAPAVVEFAPLAVVHSEAAGFMDRLHVEDGQSVEDGDLLVVLRNESLQAEAADLRLTIEQSQVQSRIHEQKGAIAACQAERSKVEALAIRLREKEAELVRLEVRAPVRGTVIAHDLASKQGTFLRVGEEILSIGREDQKEVRIAVSHDEYADFTNHLSQAARLRLPGGQVLDCVLAKIEPRASRTPPHPAFSAQAGGPLAVRPNSEAASRKKEEAQLLGEAGLLNSEQAAATAELVEPRFLGILELTSEQSRSVHAGQLGVAWVRPYKGSVLRHVWSTIEHYVARRTHAE